MKSQAEAEPWEALDLDDSELPSFLRPCKRKSPPPELPANWKTPIGGNSSTRPILQHCSFRSSQTLTQQISSDPATSPVGTYSGCVIPGPAGAVQAAMRRKVQKDPSSFGEQGDPIPTQEYIRRAVEEPGGEDEDFSRDPWLSAVDFIRSEGLVGDDGVAIGTPVSVIKSGFGTWGKVNQVVAIIKSCTPNGLGDLMVTLKDPTGKIDASVHRKVLAESEFGRDISVGAVLILKKVAVFTPSHSSGYLNITLNNISKVIAEDTLLSAKKNNSATTVKDPTPTVESEKHLRMQPKAFSLDRGKTEGIINNLRQNAYASCETHSDVEMEEGNPANGSNWLKDVTENRSELTAEKSLLGKHDLNSKTDTAADTTTSNSPHQEDRNTEMETRGNVALGIEKTNRQEVLADEQAGRSHQSHGSQRGNAMENCGRSCEEDTTNTKASKTQPLASSSTVPEWTDEQLDELFAFD